jgi:hypothetical protein
MGIHHRCQCKNRGGITRQDKIVGRSHNRYGNDHVILLNRSKIRGRITIRGSDLLRSPSGRQLITSSACRKVRAVAKKSLALS